MDELYAAFHGGGGLPPFLGLLVGAALAIGALALYDRVMVVSRKPVYRDRRRTAHETEKILYAVAQHANDGLVYSAMDGRILWANEAYCRIMGYQLHEILGRRPQEFCFPPGEGPSPEEIETFAFDPDAAEFHELTRRMNIRKNGERFWHEFSLSIVETPDGEQRVVLVSRDVTETVYREQQLERARAELHHAAHHDALTGLANRGAFRDAANARLEAGEPLGLLYIDLDKFKAINDTHGHPAGDATLLHVADAIRTAIAEETLACRIGGDEFLLACPGVSSLGDLERIAEQVRDGIRAPFPWRDTTLHVTASIGLALSDGAAACAEDLIRMADFALYKAKAPGAPAIVRYDAALHARQEAEQETIEEFVEALDAGRMEFVYQPIITAGSGRIAGFETLARWRRHDETVMTPEAFLGHAARLNRLADIDFAAIRAAATLTAEIRARGVELTGAFNTSPETLAHPDFLDRLICEITAASLTPECLNVEVLETTFFGPDTSSSPAAMRISQLRDMGLKVYLDDFGVGYAGLAHLGQLDITGIKIDRSLVTNVVQDRSKRLIASSILQLCQELSIEPCAEGIETAAQADLLIAHGCSKLQGFGISKPVSRDEMVAWATSSPDTGVYRAAGPSRRAV